MGIFLQFIRLFHDQSYSPVIVIHVQLCKHFWYEKQSQKTGRINLIDTKLVYQTYSNILRNVSMIKHISKIKHTSPDSIQKRFDELIRWIIVTRNVKMCFF